MNHRKRMRSQPVVETKRGINTEATDIKEITIEILHKCMQKNLENVLEMNTFLEKQNFPKHAYKK